MSQFIELQEAKYRYFIENAQDLIYELDQERKFFYVNPAFERVSGYSMAELRLMDYWDLVKDTHQEAVRSFYKNQIINKQIDSYFEFPIVSKDGRELWIGQNVKFEFENDWYKTARVIARDITTLKQARQELIEREKLYRLLSENARDMICLHDPQMNFVFVSQSSIEIVGYEPDQLVGTSPYDIIHPEDHNILSEIENKEKLEGIEISNVVFRLKTTDNIYVWTEMSSRPIFDEAGNLINYHSSFRNVTERKKVEDDLTASEERYKLLAGLAPVGIFRTDLAGNCTYVNERYEQITGLTKEEALGRGWLNAVNPDDKHLVLMEIYKCIQNKDEFNLEFRFCNKKTGSTVWVSCNTIRIIDNEEVYLGSLVDITSRRLMEAKLIESEHRLEEIQTIANLGGWECNLETDKVYWTQEVYNIHEVDTSFEPDLTNIFSFYQPDDKEALLTAFNKAISTGEPGDLELHFITAKKRNIWVHIKIRAHETGGKTKKLSGTIRDITELKSAENELNKTLSRLSGIIHNIHAAILVEDENRNVVIANENYCEIFELPSSSDSLTGVNCEEIAENTKVFLKYEDEFVIRINKLLEDGEPVTNEELVFKDGRVFERDYIPITIEGVQRGNIWMYRDITDRKLQEIFVQRKQNELKAFIESAPVSIALFDKEMRYIAASERWHVDYNLGAKNLLGECHYDLFPESVGKWNAIHRKALKGEILACEEEEIMNSDRSTDWIKWEVRPWLNRKDEIGGIIMMTEIITSRKLQENELKIAKQKAEEAVKAKDQFLSTVSHEIRTPMNAVLGITQILLEEDPLPEQIVNLNTLKFSANNLLALINDILDYNKIESGKIILEEVDFNLKELVNGIRQSFNHKAEEKRIKLKMEFDDKIPCIVEGDPFRLSQIFTNLVGNALKFTENGYVKINASLKKEEDESLHIVFAVEDTGIGIPEDKLQFIFDRFTQASSDTTRKYGGTGLGLAITKKLINLMGSEITVKSEVGKGSVFSFDLILKKGQMAENVLAEEYLQVDLKSLEKLNVKLLLVEDNEVNQYVAGRFLKKWGINYDIAGNGKIALGKLANNRYDLILMDLQMPELDGYQTTIQIRQLEDEYFKKVPIIALTASAMLDVRDKVFATGMNDYVTKPFNPTELYKKIFSNLSAGQKKKFSSSHKNETVSKSDLYTKIEQYTDGEESYEKELVDLYILSFKEIIVEVEAVLMAKDLENLRKLAHKHKITIEMLSLDNLQDEFQKAKDLLKTDPIDDKAIKISIQKISEICMHLIQELERT